MGKINSSESEEMIEKDCSTTGCGCEKECKCSENEGCVCSEQSSEQLLLAELETTKAKMADLNDNYLRLMADFDNFRKKTLKEKSDLLKYGSETALKNLLPVIDNFERAKTSIELATDVASLAEGVDLIYHQFISYLKENQVLPIETTNATFDTDFHEAITVIPAPSEELKGKVVDCIQKGYTLNDKVIRFAKVVVGE